MGTLVLVRHGQAGIFEQQYDCLSPTGEAQARRLGEYWTRLGVRFDAVFTGTLARQRGTEAVVRACYAAAGVDWPEPEASAAFNEFEAEGIVRELGPLLAEADPGFRKLWEERQAEPASNKRFFKMFEALMARWQEGSLAAPGIESWRAFRERVTTALEAIVEDRRRGRRVVAFTSGGVIGVAGALALRAPDHSALEVNWLSKNGSMTEFRFRAGRLSLDCFNAVPHLDDPALITYW
jgi:broad specificity phosphatase PhoE